MIKVIKILSAHIEELKKVLIQSEEEMKDPVKLEFANSTYNTTTETIVEFEEAILYLHEKDRLINKQRRKSLKVQGAPFDEDLYTKTAY